MGHIPPIKRTAVYCALSLLLLDAGYLFAQTTTLDSVEVHARSISYETGTVDISQTTGFSSSIGWQKIQRSNLSLGSLIDQEAGAQVRELGGFGSFSEISLRGAGSDQVMIFLDGLLLSDGSGGGFDLSLLDPAQTSRIDVYRGSSPIQLGKSSLGGAINLISHQLADDNRLRLAASGGSFGTRKLAATLRGKKGKNDGILSLSTAKSDNDFEFTNNNGTQFNLDDDEKQRRRNAEASRHTALLKVGRQINDNRRLDGVLQFQDKKQGIPSWNNHPATDATIDTDSWQVRGKITSDSHFSGLFNTTGELYAIRKSETYDDRNSSVGLGAQLNHYTTETQGTRLYGQWLWDLASTELNIDFRREKYRREDKLEFKPDDVSHRDSLAASAQLNYYLADETLLLTPSLRFQQFRNDYSIDSKQQNIRTTEQYTTPQLGLRYSPDGHFTLKANVGAYSREPSFYELFGDRGLFLGNEELVAEEGLNTDIGIEWLDHSLTPWLDEFKIQASAWYNTIDDMIARTYDARGIGKSQNIASARLSGIESSLQLTFSNGIAFSASLTQQNPENRSDNAAFKGKVLPGRDQHSVYTSLTLPYKQWSLIYEFDARSGRYYDTANLLEARDRELHHLTLSRNTSFGLTFSLALKNLTDKAYEDFNGYPRPGRAWYLSLSYEN